MFLKLFCEKGSPNNFSQSRSAYMKCNLSSKVKIDDYIFLKFLFFQKFFKAILPEICRKFMLEIVSNFC